MSIPTARRPLIDRLEPRAYMAAIAGSVNANVRHQTIEALGAASTAFYNAPEERPAAFYDQLVNDLGATAVRASISPNFELFNDNADPNVFDWSKFDSAVMGKVLQYNQKFKERGVTQFFLSTYTPPSWMKTNRSSNGGGSLRYDMRAEFAEYIAAVVIAAKRDYGIDFAGVSIQNEPFFPEPYESTMYDNAMLREATIAVQQKFKREGLTTKVVVNEDIATPDSDRWRWFNQPILDDPEIDRSSLVVASHVTEPTAMASQAAQLAGTGVPLWYTEVSGKPGDFPGGVRTARELSDTFTRAQATAYYYFLYNYFDVNNGTASLMQDGVPNGKYHALKHFYKYIRPGAERLETAIDETNLANPANPAGGMRLSAFKHPATGATTIVLVNDTNVSNTVTLNLGGLGAGTPLFRGFESGPNANWQSIGTVDGTGATMTVTVGGQGIVTLYNGQDRAPVTGTGIVEVEPPTLIDPVSNSQLRNAAMRGDAGLVANLIAWGADVNSADPATGWTPLHAAAAGVYPGCESIVDQLIAAGANVNATTTDGITPLHAAAMNQWVEFTTSFFAKENIVDALVDAGAAVDARDAAGRTPLMWSALTPAIVNVDVNNANVPGKLLNRGADRTLRDVPGGSTAHDFAIQEYKREVAERVSGANIGVVTDTRAPFARYAAYDRDRNGVDLVIAEDVTATLAAGDVQVVDRATGAPVTGFSYAELFSAGLTIARVGFAGRLADGNYRLTIAAGAFADASGLASRPVSVDFFVLRGDANGDRAVNFADLVTLAQNYNVASRTWSQGDFNGDGVVGFDDLVALAQRYGTTLAPPPAGLAAAAELPEDRRAPGRKWPSA